MLKKEKTATKRKKKGQYIYDGLTGHYKYYAAGTIADVRKLAEFNAEQKRFYRAHHEMFFQRTKEGEVSLCVINDVDDIEVSPEEPVRLETRAPRRRSSGKELATKKLLYFASKVLSKNDLDLFKKISLFKTQTAYEYAKACGLPIRTIRSRVERLEKRLKLALEKEKK